MENKFHFFSDNNKNALKILSFLKKKLKLTSLKKASLFIVVGGDGFMLKTLKKYYILKKPFYGINSGNYGFLMNKFSKKNLIINLFKNDLVTINPLEMTVTNKLNQVKKSIAINEVSILRQSKQTVNISINNGKKILSKNLFLMEFLYQHQQEALLIIYLSMVQF